MGCKNSDMIEQLSLHFTKDFILTCLSLSIFLHEDLSPNKVTGDLGLELQSTFCGGRGKFLSTIRLNLKVLYKYKSFPSSRKVLIRYFKQKGLMIITKMFCSMEKGWGDRKETSQCIILGKET